jgi:hypothetical protein
MRITETKTDCHLQTGQQAIDAMIHLVEICYDSRLLFWNCVMQLTKDNMMVLGEAIDGRPIGIELSDGRNGYLHVVSCRIQAGDYYEIAAVGKPNATADAMQDDEAWKNGNKTVLRFRLIAESLNLGSPDTMTPWGLLNKLNSTEWMGKEPGSCRVVHIQQKEPVSAGKTAMLDHAEFLVYVGYRPDGWISDTKNDGRQRLNGWKLEVRDEKQDGTLLDGHGGPLAPGATPVYRAFEMLHLADYTKYAFGTFLGEDTICP